MADSEPGLEPGIERSDEFTVAPPLVTDVGGTIGTGVLSTPGMIGMMEGSASVLRARPARRAPPCATA